MKEPGSTKVKRLAAIQFVFGQVQMIGATVGLCLLLMQGVTTAILVVVALTLVVSLISRFWFHGPANTVRRWIMKKYVAEFMGTFGLVFAGTGAIVANQVSGGAVTHVGIALTFGLVVLAMIYAFGDVSGAHLNPAVTLGFCLARRFPVAQVPPYLISQCAGAFLASGLLRFLFQENKSLGATLPSGSATQSLILEIVLTFLLMLVILSVSTGAKEKGITAGIAVGAVIALEAMFAGPICGASMNPARSLAPAVVSGQTQFLWVYLLAPVIGAILAVPACCAFREPGCCTAQEINA